MPRVMRRVPTAGMVNTAVGYRRGWFPPEPFDVIGAVSCLVGVAVIVYALSPMR
jgi:drug/metabolite transporter superfamily protein YnfA